MKKLGNTFDMGGKLVPVYECESCGARSIMPERIRRCEINHHHAEEYAVGIL